MTKKKTVPKKAKQKVVSETELAEMITDIRLDVGRVLNASAQDMAELAAIKRRVSQIEEAHRGVHARLNAVEQSPSAKALQDRVGGLTVRAEALESKQVDICSEIDILKRRAYSVALSEAEVIMLRIFLAAVRGVRDPSQPVR